MDVVTSAHPTDLRANSIGGVVASIDEVIHWSINSQSRLGYFPDYTDA